MATGHNDSKEQEMQLLWIDKNGEFIEGDLPEGSTGYTLVDLDGTEEEEKQEDYEWLADWYLKRLAAIDAEKELLKDQHKVRMNKLKSDESGLKYRWGERFQKVVDRDLELQKGKAVSKNYAYGRAGYRKSTKTVVTDEKAARLWAMENKESAIKTSISLLVSEFKGLEVPGVEVIKKNTFFPA